jgi:hypothetical protein
MQFPFGPFRNAGDFRVWLVASFAWIILAGVYSFAINPPLSEQLVPFGDAVSRCRDTEVAAGVPSGLAYDKCLDKQYFGPDPDIDKFAIFLRISIMFVPPIAIALVIWLLVETLRWIRRGYAG